MTTTPSDEPRGQAFARAVLAAFEAAGRTTDARVVAADGPSTTTMTKIRKAAAGESELTEPREPTWSKIDRAADWEPGSARRVWSGGAPVRRRDRVPQQDEALLNSLITNTPFVLRRLQNRVDELEAIVHLLLNYIDMADEMEPAHQAKMREHLRHMRNALVHESAPGRGGEPSSNVERPMAPAARGGESTGRQLRREQDLAGQESQDPTLAD